MNVVELMIAELLALIVPFLLVIYHLLMLKVLSAEQSALLQFCGEPQVKQ